MPQTNLTPQQVAERLGVTDETVRRWAKAGQIECIVYPSGRVKIPAAAVDAILATPTEPVAS